jgi:methyl-accepting chemotaxis protein
MGFGHNPLETGHITEAREAAADRFGGAQPVRAAAAAAREYAGQARHHLQRSQPVVDGAIETIAGLTGLVLRLGERMNSLEEALREVQGVVQTIDQIGRQTNLLALNATLEAARAGEAGRGFAIVAAEVKKLAANSRNATERITRTIDRLNHEAKRISADIETGVASGSEAQARTAEISLVLGETLTFVDALDAQMSTIAAASLAGRLGTL